MSLTQEQLHFFESFGYLLLRQAFTDDEMTSITRAADALWAEDRMVRKAKDEYQNLNGFIEASPQLDWLADDDRIHEAMCELIGDGFVWGGSEGNTGSHNAAYNHTWHCDRGDDGELQYRRIKVMIYLQPMTRKTGALRVIPGSHHLDFYRSLHPLNELHVRVDDGALDHYGVVGEELPCVALETRPGDLIIFDHYLYHAVYQKQEGRRYIALKFAAWPTTAEHDKALERHGQDPSTVKDQFRHSKRPRIAAMVRPLLARMR